MQNYKIMKPITSALALNAILFLCFVVSVILFQRGFLLTRVAVQNTNNCSLICTQNKCPFGDAILRLTNHESYCQPNKQKLILLIIDGLRYDFIESYNSSDQPQQSGISNVSHRISVFSELLRTTDHAAMYKFIADPPTTTMQRLKGLTTGSLPTFIEISDNFASEEIKEDNIIQQMFINDKRIVFLGDDTWVNLYPRYFHKLYPYPSFNVNDLDTVDNGIISHIFSEIKGDDWDVIIGHFLGVDHCGHTFGRDHPQMSSKLKQMDSVLQRIIREVNNRKENVMLLVMGDHGMTRTGDHGGDSIDEVTSVLLAYHSKIALRNDLFKYTEIPEIPQINLVPTVSLLLGLPIPHGNVGSVIPDFSYAQHLFKLSSHFQTNMSRLSEILGLLVAHEINIDQVETFLDDYAQSDAYFPSVRYRNLSSKLDAIKRRASELLVNTTERNGIFNISESNLLEIIDGYASYLKLARELCIEIWARFDYFSMYAGVFMSSFTIFLSFSVFYFNTTSFVNKVYPIYSAILLFSVILVTFVSFLVSRDMYAYLLFLTLSFCTLLLIRMLFGVLRDIKIRRNIFSYNFRSNFLISVSIASYLLSSFSNSFVVHEDSFCLFFACTFASCNYVFHQVKPKTIFRNNKNILNPSDETTVLTRNQIIKNLALVSTLLLLLRSGTNFYKCREEQGSSCIPSSFLRSFSSIKDDPAHNQYITVRFFCTVFVVCCIFYGIRCLLRKCGNLNDMSIVAYFTSLLHVISPVCLIMTWILLAVPSSLIKKQFQIARHSFALFLHFYVAFNLVLIWLMPLFVHLLRKSSEDVSNFPHNIDSIAYLFNHVKSNWRFHLSKNTDNSKSKKPIVYGLGAVYSAGLINFFCNVLSLLMLLSNDGLSLSFGLMIASIAIVVTLESIMKLDSKNPYGLNVSTATVILWMFLCNHFYFSGGHQHTFSSIQWDSAFTVWSRDYSYNMMPAFFIVLNNFSSHIIFTLSLPLLVTWPRVHRILFPKTVSVDEDFGHGDFSLLFEEREFFDSLHKIYRTWILLYAAKLTSVMIAAAVLCRHLMVWKIFAPRFIFEVATFAIIVISSIFVLLFVYRLHSCLRKWTNKLQNDQNM